MPSKLALAAAGVATAAVGFKYLDSKLHLSHDMQHLRGMLAIKKNFEHVGKEYTVSDMWYATLSGLPNRGKACLVSADDGTTYSFDDVERVSNQIAHWILSVGIRPSDVVALFMENRPGYVMAWLGMTKAGVVCALLNTNNKRKPLLHGIDIADCKAVIFGTELSGVLADISPELEARSMPLFGFGADTNPQHPCPAFATSADAAISAAPTIPVDSAVRAGIRFEDTFGYIYTSGTTGLPKVNGVARACAGLCAGCVCVSVCMCSPHYQPHTAGLIPYHSYL
jgi:acyl-coenzyme A synthetase/AMP-(fatty) acid ligase